MAIRWPARRGEISAGGASSLSGLSDVTSAAVTDKFALMANGSAYVGRALVEADISDLGTYATTPLAEADITDGTILARVGSAETITQPWQFDADVSLDFAAAINFEDSGAVSREILAMSAGGASSIKLQISWDGSDTATTTTDESDGAHTVTFNNSAQIDTGQSVFGGSSLQTAASIDYCSVASHADFNYGTDDFTIEFRCRLDTVNAQVRVIFDQRTGLNQVVPTIYQTSSGWVYHVNGATRISGGSTATATWYAIAISRVSGTTRMYVDGTQIGSSYTDGNDYITSPVIMGQAGDALGSTLAGHVGHIEELRITKGTGLYSGTSYTLDSVEFGAPAAGGNTITLGDTSTATVIQGLTVTLPEAAITDHQSALTIVESQISDLAHTPGTLQQVTDEGASSTTAINLTGGLTLSTVGLNFAQQVAASTIDCSKHLYLWGTLYGFNVTASSLNIVSEGVRGMSLHAATIDSHLNHDFAAGIDVTGNITVTGTVDGIDIATRDGNLTTAETTLADIPVSNLADGTDGELITWSAAGAPTTVAVGTSGHVLTSGGTGVAPTFQAAAGGGGFNSGSHTFKSDGNFQTWSNQPITEQFVANNTRWIQKLDLSDATSCRLIARVVVASASANTPVLKVQYSTAHETTYGAHSPIGTGATECEVSLASVAYVDSGWVTLTSAAAVDNVYVALGGDGGDSVADPGISNIIFMWK